MRKNVIKIKKKRTEQETHYKHQCMKYKIKPIRNSEEPEDDDPFNQYNSNLRNPVRSEDDETLHNLNKERDLCANFIENCKSSIDAAREEQRQLEAMETEAHQQTACETAACRSCRPHGSASATTATTSFEAHEHAE